MRDTRLTRPRLVEGDGGRADPCSQVALEGRVDHPIEAGHGVPGWEHVPGDWSSRFEEEAEACRTLLIAKARRQFRVQVCRVVGSEELLRDDRL